MIGCPAQYQRKWRWRPAGTISCRTKPHGYDGAVVILGIRDTPPERPEDLTHHTMASRTPHTLTFEETQRGQAVQIALALQNECGHLGQWSEYKNAVIP